MTSWSPTGMAWPEHDLFSNIWFTTQKKTLKMALFCYFFLFLPYVAFWGQKIAEKVNGLARTSNGEHGKGRARGEEATAERGKKKRSMNHSTLLFFQEKNIVPCTSSSSSTSKPMYPPSLKTNEDKLPSRSTTTLQPTKTLLMTTKLHMTLLFCSKQKM